MTQDEIRAIALEVADELNKVKRAGQSFSARDNVIDDYAVRFATRFLAAINEKAAPVAWHHNDYGILELSRVQRVGWKPLFTHPAIEPAGEVVVTTTEEGRCVCVTRQDEEGRILKVIWEAPAIEPAPQQASRDLQHEHTMNQFKEVCHGRNCTANKAQPTHSAECKADHDNAVGAAPLPDEVQWRNIRHAVRTLADWAFGGKDDPRWGTAWLAMVNGLSAKDGPQFNLERLARQVPPAITHDEWYAAQNRIAELLIFVKKISKQIPEKPDYWNSCSQCEHNASEAEDLLIAAGEVKP